MVEESGGKKKKIGKVSEKYLEKDREVVMNNGQYMQVGFDTNKMRGLPLDQRHKHYRFFLNETLESYYERTHGMKMGTMNQINIRKGKYFGNQFSATSIIRKISNEDTYTGLFKGNLFIEEWKDNYQDETVVFNKKAKSILDKMVTKNIVHMFLYIIEAANIPPKDNFSHSDTYLVVRTGKQ